MSEVYLPVPREGKTIEEKVQNLTDCVYRLRKELDFLLNNLDEENVIRAGSVYAENIDTRNAKIGTAQIEDLEVGGNVAMGPNAVISWGQVTSQPTIIDADTVTQISQHEINTATINVNQLNGSIANLASSVNLGSVSDYMQDKYVNFYNYSSGSAHVGLQSGGVLKLENKGTNNQDIQIENDSNYIYMSKSSPNGIEIGTNNSNGAIKLVSTRIGFLGTFPVTQQTASKLDTSATLLNVITKINGLIDKLSAYGLIGIV